MYSEFIIAIVTYKKEIESLHQYSFWTVLIASLEICQSKVWTYGSVQNLEVYEV